MQRARGLASVIVLALSIVLASVTPAQAQQMDENDRPSALAMFGDALFVRPVMAAATVLGTAVFTVTLPFTFLGGNEEEAADTLVATPAHTTFLRCLGCTPQQDRRLEMRKKVKEANKDDDAD